MKKGDKVNIKIPWRHALQRNFVDEYKIHKVKYVDDSVIEVTGHPNIFVPIEFVTKFEQKYEDAAGSKLNIGDTVMYIKPGYRELIKGYISNLSDKQASVKENLNDDYSLGRYYNAIIKI